MAKKFSLLLLIMLCMAAGARAQRDSKKEKPTLAISIRPILPSGLFDNRDLVTRINDTSFSIMPRPGISFGVILRQRINKTFTFESGIHYTQRNYATDFFIAGKKADNWNARVINYEIPFMALIYIQLGKQLYLNNAFGLSADFFPSDAVVVQNNYVQDLTRKYWVLPALVANFGFEYRTEKSGGFYIGGAYHRMLSPMGYVGFYRTNGFPDATTTLTGHYFALDLKYFLPTQRTAPVEY